MKLKAEAEQIIKSHVLWAMGAGLIPLPLVDIAAVTAIQLDMIKQLAKLYEADYSASSGKAFVSALASSTLSAIGASVVKILPGIGTVLGGVSMSVLSGASTYAVGHVAAVHLAEAGSLEGVNMADAKRAYKEAFEKGKSVVSDLKDKEGEARDVFEALEKLGKLRDQGVLTEEEFEAKKKELLERL